MTDDHNKLHPNYWPRWVIMIAQGIGMLTTVIVGWTAFDAAGLQPFATKVFVEQAVSDRVREIRSIQVGAADQLRDSTEASIVLLQSQVLATARELRELDMRINSGQATTSDRAYAEALREQLIELARLRDRLRCTLNNPGNPAACP